MGAPPNEVYTAFSFVGFVMCAIPFYWHLEAWNTGTCLYMGWVGIGCLLQCINSIVWNKNMVLRAEIYCQIVVRFQAGLNVAIPAAALCINRRLYKIATIKTVTFSASERRRAVITDLLIGLGLPILQMLGQYVIAWHSYTMVEDVGPVISNAFVVETVFFYNMWPLLIGVVSLFYSASTVYLFMKREIQFSEIMSSNRSLNRGRYIRLMALSAMDVFLTIPLASYVLARFVQAGLLPWLGWRGTHGDGHFNHVVQIPASIWRALPYTVFSLETGRWFLVLSAFIIFAFFGFADEARKHYRLAFISIATRVGFSTASFTTQGSSSHGTSSFPHMRRKGEVSVSVVTTSRNRRDSLDSFTDQLSIPSISIPGDFKTDIKIEEYSPSGSMASSSRDSLELGPHDDASHQPVVTLPTLPSASVPPHHNDPTEITVRAYSGDNAV